LELRKSFLPVLEILLHLEDGERTYLRMFINQPMRIAFILSRGKAAGT
jgi:hypothetical protein